jgi:hypothetical protein
MLLMQGCRKDPIQRESTDRKGGWYAGLRSGSSFDALQEASMAWWEANHINTPWSHNNINILGLDPVWTYGYGTYIGEVPVFLAPVANDLDEYFGSARYNLIFFQNDQSVVEPRLLVFMSQDSLYVDFDLGTFSGVGFNIKAPNIMRGVHYFHDGYYTEAPLLMIDSLLADDGGIFRDGGGNNGDDLYYNPDPSCPSAAGSNNNSCWIKTNWDLFMDWFHTAGGTGGSGGNSGSWTGGWWGNIGGSIPNGGSGSGGGTGGAGGYYIGKGNTGTGWTWATSSSLLFSNEILNNGFHKLKNCKLSDLGVPANADDRSLSVLLAEEGLFLPYYFDQLFSNSVDAYIEEGGSESLYDILMDNLNTMAYLQGPVADDLVFIDARRTGAAYVSYQLSDLYKFCIQHPHAGSGPIGQGQPSYTNEICNCMSQYSVADGNLDYTQAYLLTPEPHVSTTFRNNVMSTWPWTKAMDIRDIVDALQRFYFLDCRVYSQNFEACAMAAIEQWLIAELLQYIDLNTEIRDWMSLDISNLIKAYKLLDFIKSKGSSEEAGDYALFVFQMLMEDVEYKADRFIEFYNLIDEDPDFLLKDCGNIGAWSELASFIPDQSVQDKIASLGPGWKLQPLMMPTSAPRINLDYFGVTISQLPFINGINGPRYSPEEFLDHIRRNINEFHSQSGTSFDPIPQDISLWNSNNAKGTVISINIFPDDGSVICAQHESCCWIFSTLTAPIWPLSNDGYHPVSGNRQFGIKSLPNGNYEIFTKGVDRFYLPLNFSDPLKNAMGKLVGYMMEFIAFERADGLWMSFQNKITQFVIQKGGTVLGDVTDIKRPQAMDGLKQLLKSNNKITKVPCD